MYYDSYIEALKSAFGEKLGREVTQGEAEKSFFPFYEQIGNRSDILKNFKDDYCYTLLEEGELCVYKVTTFDDLGTFVPLDFIGVQMGELTEVGFVRVEEGDVQGTLVFKAENDSTVLSGFVSGGTSLAVNDEEGCIKSGCIKSLKFFGKGVFFKYEAETEDDDPGTIIVYAKYKPHSLNFDFEIHQPTTREFYFLPYVGSGYKLSEVFLKPYTFFNSNFFLYKKAQGDLYNNYRILLTSSASWSDYDVYKLSPESNLNTHYSDFYFGAAGTISSPNYIPYQMRLAFQKIS